MHCPDKGVGLPVAEMSIKIRKLAAQAPMQVGSCWKRAIQGALRRHIYVSETESRSVVSDSLVTPWTMKVKAKVTQVCLTLCHPMDGGVAIPFSRASSQPRD